MRDDSDMILLAADSIKIGRLRPDGKITIQYSVISAMQTPFIAVKPA
jgi:hypothetical protein